MKKKYHWNYKGDHLQIVEIEPVSKTHAKIKRIIYNNKEGKKNILMYAPFLVGMPYTMGEEARRTEAQVIKYIFSKDFKFYIDKAE